MSYKLCVFKGVEESKVYRDHASRILRPFIGEAFPEDEDSLRKDRIEHIDLEGPLDKAGWRVRDYKYFEKYLWQFTIRSQTYAESNYQNAKEIESVLAGNVDWYLYGWFRKKGDGIICQYQVIRVPNLIECVKKHGLEKLAVERANPDGSKFLAFDPSNPKMIGHCVVALFKCEQNNLTKRKAWSRWGA